MSHTHHDHRHHATTEGEAADLALLLDLDAQVLRPLLSDVLSWVDDLAAGQPPVRRILDLGTGTGTGALALAERFEAAEVIAVDKSVELLDRLQSKARNLALADRVRLVQADLDTQWPDPGPFDLIWASASLHHLADPERVLAQALAALRPGGLLVALEMDAFPRFLPDDLGIGTPGLEARCHAALAEQHAAEMPELGSDWGEHLSRVGFATPARRTFTIDLTAPLPDCAGHYAQAFLSRLRERLRARLSREDLATLDTLTADDGPDAAQHRSDLTVHATRTAWAATRP
jgi:SAM-dependent methyltransferase